MWGKNLDKKLAKEPMYTATGLMGYIPIIAIILVLTDKGGLIIIRVIVGTNTKPISVLLLRQIKNVTVYWSIEHIIVPQKDIGILRAGIETNTWYLSKTHCNIWYQVLRILRAGS